MRKMNKKSETVNVEYPDFFHWYAGFWSVKDAFMKGKDIFLQGVAARRFGLGVNLDGKPVLGIQVADKKYILSISWNSAAFIRNYQDQDWVALSCKDIRIENAMEDEPVPIRLWIPVPRGVLDAWFELGASQLELRLVKPGKGGLPLFAKSPPIKTIPLTKKDVPSPSQ